MLACNTLLRYESLGPELPNLVLNFVIQVGGPGTLPKSIKSTAYGGNLHIVGYISKVAIPYFYCYIALTETCQDSSDSSIVVPTIVKALNLRGVYVGSVAQYGYFHS